MSKTINNLSNTKINNITVLDKYKIENNRTYWLCKCDCGNIKYIDVGYIHKLKYCSHNCKLQYKKIKNKRLYSIFSSMKTRCYNNNHKSYSRYGDKGIIICDEWLNNYTLFEKWAEDNGYNDTLQIDRINNNGNYEPNNCRWVTPKQNCNNRENSVNITYNNITKTLAEWCDDFNLNYNMIYKRLNNGMSFSEAINKKVVKKNKPTKLQHITTVMLTPLLKTHTISDIAIMLKVKRTSLIARIKQLGLSYDIKNLPEPKSIIKTQCPYYPCHNNMESCKLCYCPEYDNNDCIGIKSNKGIILENGIKDCSNCNIPHIIKNYNYFINNENKYE